MKNYSYLFSDGQKVILNSEEHEKIKSVGGKSAVFLREGTLMVNTNYVQRIEETDEATDAQKKQNSDYLLKSPEERMLPKNPDLLDMNAPEDDTYKDYRKAAAENSKKSGFQVLGKGCGLDCMDCPVHRKCADCQEVHYIPESKEVCILCSYRRRKAEKAEIAL